MKFWKTLLVLLGFGAIWGFNMVVPGFAIVRSRCCEDIDSPAEEVNADLRIADTVAGRVDWEPEVVLEHRVAKTNELLQTNQAIPEDIEQGATAFASLGRFDEAQKLLNHLPPNQNQRKAELTAKVQYFQWVASKFKDKSVIQASAKSTQNLTPDYLHSNPKAVVLAAVIKLHQGYAFETLNNDQRVEIWFKRVKVLGIPIVRDSVIDLIKEQGRHADPNLFFMLSVIDSTRSQNPNEMRCSLATALMAQREIGLGDIAFVDDMKANALFNYRHSGASAVDLLIKSGSAYRASRTNFMITQAKAGRYPEDAGYWSGYKPVERPSLNGYQNWIPVQLRKLEVKIVDPFSLLAMAVLACYLIVCLDRIYIKRMPGTQQTFKISMQ